MEVEVNWEGGLITGGAGASGFFEQLISIAEIKTVLKNMVVMLFTLLNIIL